MAEADGKRTYQLRRYRLEPDALDTFVRWWRNDLVPVRLAFGFDVPYACVVPETAELIWVVGYLGDEDAFADAERRYNEWPRRLAAMSRQPAHTLDSTAHLVDPIDMQR